MELPNDRTRRIKTRTRSEEVLADVLVEVEEIRSELSVENRGHTDTLIEILVEVGALAAALHDADADEIRGAGVRLSALAFVISADG